MIQNLSNGIVGEQDADFGTETVYRLSKDFSNQQLSQQSTHSNSPEQLGNGIIGFNNISNFSRPSSGRVRSAGRDVIGTSTEFDNMPRTDLPTPTRKPSSLYNQKVASSIGTNESRVLISRRTGKSRSNRIEEESYIDYSEFGL